VSYRKLVSPTTPRHTAAPTHPNAQRDRSSVDRRRLGSKGGTDSLCFQTRVFSVRRSKLVAAPYRLRHVHKLVVEEPVHEARLAAEAVPEENDLHNPTPFQPPAQHRAHRRVTLTSTLLDIIWLA